MFKRNLLMLFTFSFIIIVCTACVGDVLKEISGNAEDPEENTSNDEEVQTNDNTENAIAEDSDGQEQENTNGESNDGIEDSANVDSDTSVSNGAKDLPDPIEMDEEVIKDTGLMLTVETMTFKDDHIALDFHAQNNSGFTKVFNSRW